MIRVRDADPARDAAVCAAVYAPYVVETAISFEEEPPDAGEMAARMARVGATHPWLVAEGPSAEVAGYAYGEPHHRRAGYRWAADVSIYVARDTRRRGAGRALYEALLDLLGRQGVRRVYAGITLPNPASVGLHEALGFRPVGVYRRVGWKLGAWHDVGWWDLVLGPDGDDPPAEPTGRARLDRDRPTPGA